MKLLILFLIFVFSFIELSETKLLNNIPAGFVPFSKIGKGKKYSTSHVNDFGADLIERMNNENDLFSNFVISPYSVSSVLLMAAAGTNNNTFFEMKKVLHLSDINNSESVLKYQSMRKNENKKKSYLSAFSMWINKKFDVYDSYIESVKNAFDASVFVSDFSSSKIVQKINTWVSDKTNKKIENALPSVDSQQAMILINAIHFKGKWKESFDSTKSFQDRFWLLDGTTKETYYMHLVEKVSYFSDKSVTVVTIPFASGLKLLVIKPQIKRNSSVLVSLAKTYLSQQGIERILSSSRTTKIDLKLPRFDASYSVTLSTILQELGMVDAFSYGSRFPYISPDALAISEVLHKVVFSVNEEGAEASAMTALYYELGLSDDSGFNFFDPTPFYVDCPFLFALLDEKTALFSGIIRDVEEASSRYRRRTNSDSL